jgi:hypothetical protein
MVMTSGFEETKRAGDYNIVQRKTCSQRQTEYDLVYNQREYKDFPEKKTNINIYKYIFNMHNYC